MGKYLENMKRNKVGLGIVTFFLLIFIITSIVGANNDKNNTIYDKNFNELSIKVSKVYFTEDADDGRVIANIPVSLSNKSDHTFLFNLYDTTYNDKYSVDNAWEDAHEIEGRIKRGEVKNSTIKVTIDTRDKSSINKLEITFNMSDLKSEEEKDVKIKLID